MRSLPALAVASSSWYCCLLAGSCWPSKTSQAGGSGLTGQFTLLCQHLHVCCQSLCSSLLLREWTASGTQGASTSIHKGVDKHAAMPVDCHLTALPLAKEMCWRPYSMAVRATALVMLHQLKRVVPRYCLNWYAGSIPLLTYRLHWLSTSSMRPGG